ncbi:MAG: C40 family peptidase [Helicobacter sp.]|nr:C40 family peptidase [Helicobacter sp.]
MKFIKLILIFWVMFFIGGCSLTPLPEDKNKQDNTNNIEYSVQVGSFENSNNAWKLVEKLNKYNLDAFLLNVNNTYKVRFGHYTSKQEAIKAAKKFQEKRYFEEFFIISSENFTPKSATQKIRDELYHNAYGYIGVSYKWGGTSAKGFDCSGLTYTVYRLSGINIPRSSRDQFQTGKPVPKNKLKVGDLIFFSVGRKRIDHVGIYIGDNQFIHAPGRNKKVRIDVLDTEYWVKSYRGARNYL